MRSGSFIARLAREDSGAASVEYALLAAGIAAAIIIASFALGLRVYGLYEYSLAEMSREM